MENEIQGPRTVADFNLMDKLAWAGKTDEQIKRALKALRSEVIPLAGGHLACSSCRQIITLNTCPECGQPEVTNAR